MNNFLKTILLSLLLASSTVYASAHSDWEEAGESTDSENHSYVRNVVEGVGSALAKKAKKDIKNKTARFLVGALNEVVPGTKMLAGAAMFYSGKETDKHKGKGTVGRKGGQALKDVVEYLPGGTTATAFAKYLKPADCETLTEGVVRVVSRKFTKIRAEDGFNAGAGDTAAALVSLMPYGSYVTAATRSLGQQLDPNARSLSEGVANYLYSYVAPQEEAEASEESDEDDVFFECTEV